LLRRRRDKHRWHRHFERRIWAENSDEEPLKKAVFVWRRARKSVLPSVFDCFVKSRQQRFGYFVEVVQDLAYRPTLVVRRPAQLLIRKAGGQGLNFGLYPVHGVRKTLQVGR